MIIKPGDLPPRPTEPEVLEVTGVVGQINFAAYPAGKALLGAAWDVKPGNALLFTLTNERGTFTYRAVCDADPGSGFRYVLGRRESQVTEQYVVVDFGELPKRAPKLCITLSTALLRAEIRSLGEKALAHVRAHGTSVGLNPERIVF